MELTLEEALQKAFEAHKAGQIQEAERLYTSILKAQPKHPDANHNMGVLAVGVGKVQEALPFFKTALEANSSIGQYWLSYIDALIKLDRIVDAKSLLDQAKSKGANGEAFDQLEQMLNAPNVVPKNPPQDQLQQLIKLYQQGQLQQTLDNAKQLLSQFPDSLTLYDIQGATNAKLGRFEAAIAGFKQALKIKPDYASAYYNMGNVLKDKNDLEAAIESYNQALKISPNLIDTHYNKCELYEKSNNLAGLSKAISIAKATLKDIPDNLNLYEALYDYRSDNYEHCEKLISLISVDQISSKRTPSFWKLKAQLQHHQKDYKLAFNTFTEMNNAVINSSDYKGKEAQIYFDEHLSRVKQLNKIAETPYSKSLSDPSTDTPTFLIGFPRSGTTLLDTILRTHSKIEVVEEKNMVLEVSGHLGRSLSIADIENLPVEELEDAREVYFKELAKYVSTKNSTCVIDKLPLNILDLPLIHQLFPTAKFILALRHPLDSILSCWMQTFKLNNAMSNMVELDRIVDFYGVAMAFLELSEKRYSLSVHRIRYEDLVLDMKLEVSNLLKFLELDWENELENYQSTALKRGIINTPSYFQVSQPIYKTATYRWEKYREPLEKHFVKIDKWTTKFGYEL